MSRFRLELDVLRCLCLVFSKLRVVGGRRRSGATHNNNKTMHCKKKLNWGEKVGFFERTMQFLGS